MMDLADILLKTFIGAISGLIVSFFTTKYTLNKFYHEKWWDKRMEFFKELTDTLYKIKKIEKRWYDDQSELAPRKIDTNSVSHDEEYTQMDIDYEAQIEALKRIHELSPLFLSDKCHILIGNYLSNQTHLLECYVRDEIDILKAHEDSYSDTEKLFEEIIQESIRLLKPHRR